MVAVVDWGTGAVVGGWVWRGRATSKSLTRRRCSRWDLEEDEEARGGRGRREDRRMNHLEKIQEEEELAILQQHRDDLRDLSRPSSKEEEEVALSPVLNRTLPGVKASSCRGEPSILLSLFSLFWERSGWCRMLVGLVKVVVEGRERDRSPVGAKGGRRRRRERRRKLLQLRRFDVSEGRIRSGRKKRGRRKGR